MHRQKALFASARPGPAIAAARRASRKLRNVLIQAGVLPEEPAGEDLRQFLVRGHAGPLRPSVRRARTLSYARLRRPED